MRLVIRADGSPRIGSGHVMRCLAIASRMLELGHGVTWWSDELDDASKSRVAGMGIELEPVPETPAYRSDDVLLIDGYHLGDELADMTRRRGTKVVRIDDNGHSGHAHADVIIDPSPVSDRSTYPEAPATARFLCGPRYVPIGAAYRAVRPPEPPRHAELASLLVSLGGNAPGELVASVASGLADYSGVVHLVIGGQQEGTDDIGSVAATQGWHTHRNLEHLADLMTSVDAAVLAGGTTNWEACCLGLPRLMVQTADNQAEVARFLDDAGTGVFLGPMEHVTPEDIRRGVERLADATTRRRMAEAAWALVDGDGVARIGAHLMSLVLEVRAARADDTRTIWEWANDSRTRLASFTSDPIPWSDHERWFAAKLDDPSVVMHVVGEPGSGPVAFVWYGREDHAKLVVSINTAPEARGRGLGAAALIASAEALPRGEAVEVEALIRSDNRASRKAFERADFSFSERVVVDGIEAVRYHKPLGGPD